MVLRLEQEVEERRRKLDAAAGIAADGKSLGATGGLGVRDPRLYTGHWRVIVVGDQVMVL